MTGSSRQSQIEEILSRRLNNAARGIPSRPPGPAPLSFVQQGLWLSWRLSDGLTEGIRPTAYRLRGDVDATEVSRAIDAIVERHETLRSTFPLIDDAPVQIAHPPQHIALPVHDVSNDQNPEEAANQLARAHIDRGFDLEGEPPFDPLLIRVGPRDHLLAIRIHHIVFDGWSELVLANELRRRLAPSWRGAEYEQPAPGLQYGDYAAWQRSTVTDAVLEDSMSFWRDRLLPLPGLPELPATSLDTRRRQRISEINLGPDRSKALDDFGRTMGATTFMVLLAAIEVLVGRLSREREFLIGVSTAGRDRPGTEDVIGCFINTVLVRADLGDDLTFRMLVEQTRSEVLGAMSHAHVPYGRIISEFRPWSEGDTRPLFNIHFQMRDFPVERGDAEDFSVEPQPSLAALGRQLAFRARHHDHGTEITVAFDAGHFDESVVDRWLTHLDTFLEAVLDDPDIEVWRAPLLKEIERREILDSYGGASNVHATHAALVHERFFGHAVTQPGADAFIDRATTTSYEKLADRVDTVVDWVQGERAGGAPIAMFLPRGLDSVVATLGILAAGATCVPVDTAVTAEWLEFIVSDSDCALILTDRVHSARASGLGVPVVAIEDLPTAPRLQSARPAVPRDANAFILYTSGSTGRPKGVMMEHRNLAEFIDHHGDIYELGSGDRVIQFHSISFDGFLTNVVSPLSHGATIVLRDEESLGSIERFLQWVEDSSITHVFVPTSFFHEIATRVGDRALRVGEKVRFFGFGGEKLRSDALRSWHSTIGDRVRVMNTYGPTETTVWVTSNELTSPIEADYVNVPIGRPSPKAAVYILDEDGAPLPIGAVGELCIGGPLVNRGYIGRPAETAARFVPDPHLGEEGAAMYRTGDLAAWRADGDILFLGRADRQVKIRGFRIELEAVEVILRSHPAVSDAAVIVRDGPGDSPLLIAYVAASSAVDPTELKLFAAEKLASFMRPQAIMVLDRLPRTLSGKLDEQALPKYDRSSIEAEETHMRPDISTIVSQIWADVLEVDRVPVGATFFELGGHSLLAIRLLTRVRDELGVDLPLTTLFTHAAIEDFTAQVLQAAGARVSVDPTPESIQGQDDEFEALLSEIEAMSDEEAAALLAELEGDDTP